jgi:hypothetical protein
MTCTPNPCPQPPTYACCFSDGACLERTEAQCISLGGTSRLGDPTCSPNPCPQPPTFACCFSDGACAVRTQAQCTAEGGTADLTNTECEPNECPQPPRFACCTDDQQCSLTLDEDDCDAMNGVFLGGNYPNCDPNPCSPLPEGACCTPNGSCTTANRPVCTGMGGTFQGAFTDCEPNECPQPRGACCFDDERVCTVQTPMNCQAAGGTYEGDDTICEPDPCERACCRPDGQCNQLDETTCTEMGGTFFAEHICDPKVFICPIEIGACCQGPSCTGGLSQKVCGAAGGIFQGEGSDCDPNPCQVPRIVGANPPRNAINARQPNNLDGSNPARVGNLVLTFDAPAAGMIPADFNVTVVGPGATPTVVGVVSNGNDATLQFDGLVPIDRTATPPQGGWLVITHKASATSTCLGFLPGDVTNDRTTNSFDILRLIDCLNRAVVCAPYQSDVDVTGITNTFDILREVDLLNGAGQLGAWNGRSIPPSPCQ